MKKKILKTYRENKYCVECGGKCCKAMPGTYSPDDLLSHAEKNGGFKEYLFKKLTSGSCAIDWWEGDPPIYYLRPRIKNCTLVFHASWGGKCVFLSSRGCTLRFEFRPLNCRSVKPEDKNTQCSFSNGMEDDSRRIKLYFARLWLPYQDILVSAGKDAEKFIGKENLHEPWSEEDDPIKPDILNSLIW